MQFFILKWICILPSPLYFSHAAECGRIPILVFHYDDKNKYVLINWLLKKVIYVFGSRS